MKHIPYVARPATHIKLQIETTEEVEPQIPDGGLQAKPSELVCPFRFVGKSECPCSLVVGPSNGLSPQCFAGLGSFLHRLAAYTINKHVYLFYPLIMFHVHAHVRSPRHSLFHLYPADQRFSKFRVRSGLFAFFWIQTESDGGVFFYYSTSAAVETRSRVPASISWSVTTYLAYAWRISRNKNQHGNWASWMSLGRKNGSI